MKILTFWFLYIPIVCYFNFLRLLNAYDEHQTLLKEQDSLKRKAENGYVHFVESGRDV